MARKNFTDLTSAEKLAFGAEVKAEVRSVLAALAGRILEPDREHIVECVDHNELGVALEHLCDALIEEEASLPGSEYLRISALFEKMDLPPCGRLTSLAARVE